MSTPNEHLVALIERAAANVGSEAKLARAMDMDPPTLSNIKAGKRPCPPEVRALLAGYAREDAVQELVRAHLERTEGTRRGEQLRILLGNVSRATGAASVFGALVLGSLICWPTPSQARTVANVIDTMIGKVKWRRLFQPA